MSFLALNLAAAAGTLSPLAGEYQCASMMAPHLLSLTISDVDDKQYVTALTKDRKTKKVLQSVDNAEVTKTAMAEGEGHSQDWVLSFEGGTLEIDILPDNALNVILIADERQLAFWPCGRSGLKSKVQP